MERSSPNTKYAINFNCQSAPETFINFSTLKVAETTFFTVGFLNVGETHKFSLRLVRNPKLKLESQIKLEDTNDDDEAEISHLPYIPLADWEEIETYNRDGMPEIHT